MHMLTCLDHAYGSCMPRGVQATLQRAADDPILLLEAAQSAGLPWSMEDAQNKSQQLHTALSQGLLQAKPNSMGKLMTLANSCQDADSGCNTVATSALTTFLTHYRQVSPSEHFVSVQGTLVFGPPRWPQYKSISEYRSFPMRTRTCTFAVQACWKQVGT